jgi:hypothetical protein
MGPVVGEMYCAVFPFVSSSAGSREGKEGRGDIQTNSPNLRRSPTKQIPMLSSRFNAVLRPYLCARVRTWGFVSASPCSAPSDRNGGRGEGEDAGEEGEMEHMGGLPSGKIVRRNEGSGIEAR